jgi:hypothetical protein
MLLTQQFHDFVIPAGLSRTVTSRHCLMLQSVRQGYAPAQSRDAGDHDDA